MSHFQNRLNLLKKPPFLAYMIGFLFAAFGNGLGYIALSWIAVTNNTSVASMAILMALFWGPNVFLGPFMGVIADRLSRKSLILISHILRAIIFIGFSIYLHWHFSVIAVYALQLCNGIAFTLFYATAFGFMRELVPEQELMYANSTIDIMYEVGNLVGMGLAGLLIAWTSDSTAILINGITFVICVACLLFIPKKALCHGGQREKRTIRLMQDYRDGIRYLLQRKQLMKIYTIQLLILLTFLTSPLLLVPFSKLVLHATVGQFGKIEASASIGIVVGGLFMPWLAEKMGLMRTLLFFTTCLCVTFGVFGYVRSIPIAAALYFAIGFSAAIWPLIITKAQGLTSIDYQGRVQSTFNSLSGTMMLVFYFVMMVMGARFPVGYLYWAEVVITLMAMVFLVKTGSVFRGPTVESHR